ncbi:hypothetical protein LTR37_016419, partial [Vermiconidia calcicola]
DSHLLPDTTRPSAKGQEKKDRSGRPWLEIVVGRTTYQRREERRRRRDNTQHCAAEVTSEGSV